MTAALILCPEGARPDRTLLGLTVGERLLLALSYGGVDRVAFAGAGPRPESERAGLTVVEAEAFAGEQGVWLLPADLVFDRGLLGEEQPPADLPLRRLAPGDLDAVLGDAAGRAAELGDGRADSGVGYALRVTDGASARQAERALLLSLRKPIDGFISQHLNRHVSTAITRHLVKLPLRPNHWTVVFMFIGIAAGVMATRAEHWWALVLAGLLFQAQSILDGCDGEMARITYRFSHSGQWLDSIGDDLTNYIFTLGLAIGLARVYQQPWFYVAGGITFAVQCAASGIMYRRMIIWGTGDLLAIPDTVTTVDDGSLWSRTLKVARIISKRDVFVFICAALTALQLPLAAFLAIGGGTYPTFLGVLVNDRRVAKMTPPGR